MRWFGLFFFLLGIHAGAEDLIMRQGKKQVAALPLQRIKAAWTPHTLKLDGGKRAYWVVPLQPILKKTFGKKLYGPDTTFIFECKDGYRAPVKSEELQKYPAYLAFASADSKPFVYEGKPAGPYYLVWDTNKFPQRKQAGAWPYQVLAIERASWSEQYSAVLPPPRSSVQVKRGFAVFRRHCLNCHQVNGQGGSMAVDLNSPYSVTEYIREPFLYKIIDNPQSVRRRATMPPLDPTLKNRPQAIKDLIAYLKAKAEQRKSRSAKPAK
jgi:mono/diheme cytochrome c family protein